MSTQRLDIVNIGLMVLSLISAFLFPAETFLVAIMILGPLHYLTEMPWLERKGFFIPSKKNVWMLIGVAGVLLFLIFGKELLPSGSGGWAFRTSGMLAGALFFLALVLIRFKKVSSILIALGLILIVSWLLSASSEYTQLFLTLFPTLIHVFIFTSAFILYGALKHKSRTGIASLVVYALCTVIIFMIVPSPSSTALAPGVIDLYYYQADIHMSLVSLLNFPTIGPDNYDLDTLIFYSPTGIMIMRFIAFAYMYHFLNWFSKTSIIKWHETKRVVLFSVFGLWIGILILYWIDLPISLSILYTFGLFHVILEYPLNHRSFIGIAEELRSIFKGVRSADATS
jgi:hypothetical protein